MPPHRFVLVQDLILLTTDCSSNQHQGAQREANRTSALNIPFHRFEVISFHFAVKEKSWCGVCRTRVLEVLRAYSDARCVVGLRIYAGKASQMEHFTHHWASTFTMTSPNIICNNNRTCVSWSCGKSSKNTPSSLLLTTFVSPSGCIWSPLLLWYLWLWLGLFHSCDCGRLWTTLCWWTGPWRTDLLTHF